jgi:hypothetical protein
MLGNLLAGTEESPGEVLVKNGKKIKVIRGMAGYGANLANRQKQAMKKDDIFDVVPEGVEATVPYRGNVRDIVHQVAHFCVSFFCSDVFAALRRTGVGHFVLRGYDYSRDAGQCALCENHGRREARVGRPRRGSDSVNASIFISGGHTLIQHWPPEPVPPRSCRRPDA